MTCPICERSLQESEREGCRFAHCPECGGLWFDFEDIDRMAAAAAGESPGEQPVRPSGRHVSPEGGTLRCPRCEGGLVTVESGEHPYLTCVVCYGRWVDGKSLPKDGGLSRRIRVLFRKLSRRS